MSTDDDMIHINIPNLDKEKQRQAIVSIKNLLDKCHNKNFVCILCIEDKENKGIMNHNHFVGNDLFNIKVLCHLIETLPKILKKIIK